MDPLRSTQSTPREISVEPLDRITRQPDVMGGKACIRGLRVTVGMVVGQIGAGQSLESILQALRYAAWRAEEREVPLVSA